jgi:hypothetical protein
LFLGNWPEGARRFHGGIDELYITYDIQQSSNFMPTDYITTTSPSTFGLWHFDESAGSTVQSASGSSYNLNNWIWTTRNSENTAVSWSTGETTPTITVSPTETTTYSVTVTQGDQTCTSDVTITVLPNETFYADADGDGFGNFEMPLTTCDGVIPEGYTLDNTDCNDGDALNYPFASCDDGDPCTIEDVIQLDCTCAGFVADSDEDGTCDANDLCQGGLEPGTPCDDGEPCTVNDVIQSDCFCFGTVVDEDNDETWNTLLSVSIFICKGTSDRYLFANFI